MASGSPRQLPDATEWHAQYLRAIAFTVDSHVSDDQNWWRDVTGSDPETSTRKPQSRVDSGVVEGSSLVLEVNPLRVQWTLSPHLDPENLPTSFPTLGPVHQRRGPFTELVSRWLQDAPAIKRLAFAGNLLQFAHTREECYKRLDQYLSHTDVDPSTSDFMYRVNRRRASGTGIPELDVNRLCTWACVTLSFGMHVQSLPSGDSRDVSIGEDQHACTLELDINTVPDSAGAELPQDRLTDILVELAEYGLEIAEIGDI